MKATLIALAAALGIAFAVPAAGFAHDGQAPVAKPKPGKAKRPAPLRAAPEAAGGTLDKAKIIYF